MLAVAALLLAASPCLAATHGGPGFLEGLLVMLTVAFTWITFITLLCLVPLVIFLVKAAAVGLVIWVLFKLLKD